MRIAGIILTGLVLMSSPCFAEESFITPNKNEGTDQFTFIDKRYPFLSGQSYTIVNYKDPNHWTVEFNKALGRHGVYGEIIDCKLLIDIPMDTKNLNHSYGAYCDLKQDLQKMTVTICNDTMIDRLNISVAADIADKRSLAASVVSNCYGR